MDGGIVLLRRVPVRGVVEVDVKPCTWLLVSFASSATNVLAVASAGRIGTEIKAKRSAILGRTERGGFEAGGFNTLKECAARRLPGSHGAISQGKNGACTVHHTDGS
jgi:hypothetical protein